jgi:hypothetical protein
VSAVPKFRTPGELMPRFTVSWSLSVDAHDPVDAADRAWRAAFLHSDRTAATLVKVTDAIGGESQIIDWVTHQRCGVPQPEPTKRYPLAKDVNTELLWRCQCCGSWDVQLSYPAWHDPNNGYAYVSTDAEAEPTYFWCQHCEADSGRHIIRADEWDEDGVKPEYEAHAAFWSDHPPGTAPVKPEEIPE